MKVGWVWTRGRGVSSVMFVVVYFHILLAVVARGVKDREVGKMVYEGSGCGTGFPMDGHALVGYGWMMAM